ncbi:uncharacterized protein LOC118741847 [Rhagoletis pomonella]|uniref:uncharacterized protein LOC118741847 n=1 Tax=Rhagoletis pomonella TaxID=28610 RepID=UPI00178624E3|nr:uncharacterized protein LOC118741847 [Rhagoletis pomonella]
MERRFHNNAQLKQEHQKFMFDYITLGHMEPAGNFDPKRTYFLPHHAVLKPNSTTTKLRVVFDGSCRTTNGLSLNDQLLVGPTIQRDLFDIILNFRKYKLGFTGDIEKMYRQILVDPDDQSLQRILWRRSNDEPIKEYNLKTVTYGTSAAPFLATRTLKQIANDNANADPKASEAISQYFYVDDFKASATDEATAIQLKEEICALLFDAGLHLRKWSSNSATFLESIPSEDREVQFDTCIDSTCTVKTLGLLWDTSTDSFKYSVCLPSNQHTTKRSVLSDLARILPQELLSNEIWWHGPGELKDIPETCHLVPPLEDDITQEERKSTVALASVTTEVSVIERYSCYTRLLRITSLLLRFVNNCKANELRTAHDVLVRSAQAGSYTFELRTIGQDRQLPSSHKLAPLAPFIDEQGLLRVGVRVTNAKINYNQKHPFIMDKTHPLTKLIVRGYHIRYLHAGHRQLHYLLALKYWIPGVTYVIKQCIFKCTVCMRHRGISYQQQMGDIPKYRLDPGSPFLNTGIDFAGPIQRLSLHHYEDSLRRFSDNGTNFVGANQHLRELYQYINDSTTQETISRASAEQEIQWHFSPPSGPHFGGIWEAGVKSVKYHLKRTLADASVTYEELNTIICQIEGCFNSRPLCTKFEGDIDPLTPAHFLIMRPMTSLPDKNLINLKENAVNRWQYLQKLTQHFWKRWSIEYVTQLQQRPKWSQRLRNLEINDVVIIKDDNLPPTQWSIGKISEVHPGSDGLVRVASVDTFKGTLKRPIVKLCPLFIDI